MADNSITFSTALDNKQLEKDLAKTKREIEKLELSTADQEKRKSPLVQQAQELEQRMRAAREEARKYQADWAAGAAGADKSQSDAIMRAQQLEAAHAKVVAQIDKVDAKLAPSYEKLNAMREKAGGIERELVKASGGANRMGQAVDAAGKHMDKFTNRVKALARRVLVFSVITMGLRQMRTWLGKVIKTNDEATGAVARLKGALLTLAQPLVNAIIPAFTALVNILAQVVGVLAEVMSSLFGTTVDASKEAAENLYEETDALDKTGEAAKKAEKSLAGFDEINKLSDNSASSGQAGSEAIKPDFSSGDENWLEMILGQTAGWVAAALTLGGIALIAIGAATGSFAKVVAGLLLLGVGLVVAAETGALDSWVEKLGLNRVQEFVVLAIMLGGIAIVAIAAATGNILMVIAGLVLLGVAVSYTMNSGMMGDWVGSLGLARAAQYVTAALLIGGMALVVIGAVTCNFLMVVAGLALLAAGVYIGEKSGVFENWWTALGLSEAAKWITAALIIGGIAFVVFGIITKNVLMVITGIGMFATGAYVGNKTGTFDSWWNILGLPQVQGWVTAALLLGGVALTVFGIVLKNIPMFLGGLAMLFAGVNYGEKTGTFDNWWSVLGLEHADSWVTAALLVGGMALIVIGIITANILMVVGGLALLSVGVVYGDNTGTFQSWAETLGLPEVAGWVSTAIMMAGVALIAIGALMLNPLMVIAGLGLLGVGAISKSFGSSAKGSKGVNVPASVSVADHQVPRLAQGAVIPPNREFMAVLGDQRSGTNIEAPLDTIKQGLREVMAEAGGGQAGPLEVRLILSAKPGMAREMKFELDRESKRQGVKLVQGV